MGSCAKTGDAGKAANGCECVYKGLKATAGVIAITALVIGVLSILAQQGVIGSSYNLVNKGLYAGGCLGGGALILGVLIYVLWPKKNQETTPPAEPPKAPPEATPSLDKSKIPDSPPAALVASEEDPKKKAAAVSSTIPTEPPKAPLKATSSTTHAAPPAKTQTYTYVLPEDPRKPEINAFWAGEERKDAQKKAAAAMATTQTVTVPTQAQAPAETSNGAAPQATTPQVEPAVATTTQSGQVSSSQSQAALPQQDAAQAHLTRLHAESVVLVPRDALEELYNLPPVEPCTWVAPAPGPIDMSRHRNLKPSGPSGPNLHLPLIVVPDIQQRRAAAYDNKNRVTRFMVAKAGEPLPGSFGNSPVFGARLFGEIIGANWGTAIASDSPYIDHAFYVMWRDSPNSLKESFRLPPGYVPDTNASRV